MLLLVNCLFIYLGLEQAIHFLLGDVTKGGKFRRCSHAVPVHSFIRHTRVIYPEKGSCAWITLQKPYPHSMLTLKQQAVGTQTGLTQKRYGTLSIMSSTSTSRNRHPSRCSVETSLSGGTRLHPVGGCLRTNALTASHLCPRAGLPMMVCWSAPITAGLSLGRVTVIASRSRSRTWRHRHLREPV